MRLNSLYLKVVLLPASPFPLLITMAEDTRSDATNSPSTGDGALSPMSTYAKLSNDNKLRFKQLIDVQSAAKMTQNAASALRLTEDERKELENPPGPRDWSSVYPEALRKAVKAELDSVEPKPDPILVKEDEEMMATAKELNEKA